MYSTLIILPHSTSWFIVRTMNNIFSSIPPKRPFLAAVTAGKVSFEENALHHAAGGAQGYLAP